MKVKIAGRILTLLVVLSVVLSSILIVPLTANASTVTKNEKSYDIAVVFDNSGSMYINPGIKNWSRAKYAMEIFASMLNYDKDKLHIFPMWEVTCDGSKPTSGGSFAPIEIGSKSDIDKITKMFTPKASGTPYEPVKEAYDYLSKSGLDEKWLIVLTDGEFKYETRDQQGEILITNIEERLSSLASEDIKIQYLGFAEANKINGNEANNFFVKMSSGTSLKDDIVDICNSIFQRSVLPANRLNGQKLNLDLSMKNIIVFAQGANAKVSSLKSGDGKEVGITLDSGQRKYSEYGAANYPNALVDDTLAGQVVTFDSCPKGEYTLSYADADIIQVFYEPDVDIEVTVTDSEGQVIDASSELTAGEYTITSRIIDGTTGEDVTNHELMGNDVKIKTYVKTSEDSDYTEYDNGAAITFNPNDDVEIYIEGEYLEKYKISSKDDPDLSWLSNIHIKDADLHFNIEAVAEQNWYKLKDHDEWKPIRINVTFDGEPMTDEQVKNIQLDLSTSKELKFRYEVIPGESAYYVYIAQDENGDYVEPSTGKYKLKVNASYTDEFGEAHSADDSVSFEIQKYGKIWRILKWVLIILILLAIWLFFMTRKVLPKSIVKDTANFVTMSSGELDSTFVDLEYRKKGKSLSISGSNAVDYNEQCSVTFDLRPVDNRFTPSRRRRIAITGISSPCDEVKVAGTKYMNYEGRWIKVTDLKKAETGKEIPPIDQEISCSPRFELSRSGGLSSLMCKTKTIK